jgi:hypothetical protein
MADYIFLFKVFLSFLTGGIFTAITLYAAERYGPRLGGIIAGLPSTTAVGLFFIGYTQSPQAASQAASLMPAAVGGSLIFVVIYVMLCKRTGYMLALLTASAAWFMVSLPLAYYRFQDINTATLFFFLVWIAAFYGMNRQKVASKLPKKIEYTIGQKIARAVFAGAVIASAVVVSSLAGPLWGGALAAFPAMFLTTFIILCRSYGCEYSTEFAKNTPLGLMGVIPYLWGVHYFYPSYGLAGGTLIAYALSLSMTGAVYWLVNRPPIMQTRSLKSTRSRIEAQ